MIADEILLKEFTTVVDKVYPYAGNLLKSCHVRIIRTYWGRPPKLLQYIGIYCPSPLLATLKTQQTALREIAEQMDLIDVVCMNATRLIRDPKSTVKEVNPRFWLELLWVASEGNS
jgi:hypothetical protein